MARRPRTASPLGTRTGRATLTNILTGRSNATTVPRQAQREGRNAVSRLRNGQTRALARRIASSSGVSLSTAARRAQSASGGGRTRPTPRLRRDGADGNVVRNPRRFSADGDVTR
jgi:hypothetical protein